MLSDSLSLPKPYYQDDSGIVIYHGDCREIMPLLEAGSISAVITDPKAKRKYLRKEKAAFDSQWTSEYGRRDQSLSKSLATLEIDQDGELFLATT
jgi:DNA modification methylase